MAYYPVVPPQSLAPGSIIPNPYVQNAIPPHVQGMAPGMMPPQPPSVPVPYHGYPSWGGPPSHSVPPTWPQQHPAAGPNVRSSAPGPLQHPAQAAVPTVSASRAFPPQGVILQEQPQNLQSASSSQQPAQMPPVGMASEFRSLREEIMADTGGPAPRQHHPPPPHLLPPPHAPAPAAYQQPAPAPPLPLPSKVPPPQVPHVKERQRERDPRKPPHKETPSRTHDAKRPLDTNKLTSAAPAHIRHAHSTSHRPASTSQLSSLSAAAKEAAKEPPVKPSEFLCRIKFRNTLPDIPFDPKFRHYPVDAERFIKYKPTLLEKGYKHTIHTDPDLAIPIDLIDPNFYVVPPNHPKAALAAEDQELLEEAGSRGGAAGRNKAERRPQMWLRKPEYIALLDPDLAVRRSKPIQHVRPPDESEQVTRTVEEQIERIEETFTAVRSVPKHPTNAALTPLQVMPVFPDFDLWPNVYAQVVFDADPTDEICTSRQDLTLDRDALASSAVMKIFASAGDASNKYLVYMVPSASARKRMKRTDGSIPEHDQPSPTEGSVEEMEWVREYAFQRDDRDQQDQFLMVFRDGAAYYNRIASKLLLHKRSAKLAGRDRSGEHREQQKPSRITLQRRELKETEIKSRADRLNELIHAPPRENAADDIDDDDDDDWLQHEVSTRSGDGAGPARRSAAGSSSSAARSGENDKDYDDED